MSGKNYSNRKSLLLIMLSNILMLVISCSVCFSQQTAKPPVSADVAEISENEMINLYSINPLDEVLIVMYAGEKQIGEFKKYVQSDGTVYLPFLEKDVKIGGMRVLEAQKLIEDLALKYIKSPRIQITVTSSSSQSVSTYGKVENRTIDLKIPMKILHLMARVGGPQEGARTDSIKVISRNGEIRIFNYEKANKNPNGANNFYLRPGDIIYVPDEGNMNVVVVGNVNKAGVYSIKDDKHVVDALLKAGSWSETADIKNVKLGEEC